jgi:glycosyltransferase involved in cell wall biosynthesis
VTPTLTICVPTIGRPSLTETLASIARQALIPGDQVLAVFDSFGADPTLYEQTHAIVTGFGFTFVAYNGHTHFYGNPQLNHAMTLATGDYFCALGDDDVYVDGAIARLRASLQPGKATLFQFFTPPYMVGEHDPRRFVLWADKKLRVANLSGCCIAAPRNCLVPVSEDRRIEVDFEWIAEIVAKTGEKPIWLKDCLIIARPDLRNGQTVHQGVATCKGCGVTVFLEDLSDRLCAECVGVVPRELIGARA